MNIDNSTIESILSRFEHDMNSYGYGGIYREIGEICKKLQGAGVDVSKYYFINNYVNPPQRHDIVIEHLEGY
jgi:hypothetical protein